ncbi:VCBS repeat-containing protein, partial [Salipiger sp. HF18]|nr:VCBS repeat-containing protein [Salipiger sp. HF18]
MCLGAADPALAEPVLTGAGYLEPTTRYGHAVLGDGVEWGALRLRLREADGGTRDVLLR